MPHLALIFLSNLNTAEKDFLTLYVMRLPVEGLPAAEQAEAFVVPVMEREGGMLLALPVGFIPEEWIQQGMVAAEDSPFGPSIEILVQAMEEDDAGQEVPLEISINCLLMDFSWAVLPGLREFDPVTEGDGIQCFLRRPFFLYLFLHLVSFALKVGIHHREGGTKDVGSRRFMWW